MNSSINLLSQDKETSFKKQRQIFLLRIIAYSSLGVTAFISLVIFIVSSLIPISSIKEEQDQLLSSIKQLQTKNAKLFVVKDRLTNIDKIIKKRTNFPQIVDDVLTAVPVNTSINNFEIGKEEVTINISSNSLKTLDKLINNFTELTDKNKSYKSFFVKNLSANKARGIYSVTIVGKLNE